MSAPHDARRERLEEVLSHKNRFNPEIAADIRSLLRDEQRLRKELRALLTAVTFGPVSELPNGAGPGYMARVPMAFVTDARAALSTPPEEKGR